MVTSGPVMAKQAVPAGKHRNILARKLVRDMRHSAMQFIAMVLRRNLLCRMQPGRSVG